jgi:transposase
VPKGLKLMRLTVLSDQVLLFTRTTQPHADCPGCHTTSHQLHSYYRRTLQDLSWGKWAVRLYVQVKRLVCANPACFKQTFAESLGQAVQRYARRTARCDQTLQKLAFELGGEGGKRVAKQIQIKVSGDTLLRLIRATPLPQRPTPRVLAVDDFALAKGLRYGTLLLDLERRQVVDLLPDREMTTLAAWLKAHPGVEIVSRDRSSAYSEAVKTSLPHAIQVADRFHLAQNLKSTVERFVRRTYPKITTILKPPPPPVRERSKEVATKPIPPGRKVKPVRLTRQAQAKATTQANRMALYHKIHSLHQQGLRGYQIAKELGINAARVSQYLKSPPQPSVYATRSSKLDPYKPYLEQRFFKEQCHNSVQLLREIKAQGYSGGGTIVVGYITKLRAELTDPNQSEPNQAVVPPVKATSTKTKLASPRQISWWFCLPPERLSRVQREQLHQLCAGDKELERAYQLSQQFGQLLGSRGAKGLYAWLKAVETEPISEFESFSWGLARDREAVEAGITSRFSQGQAEGQINRLKLLKRQMYNRANFDLLKARVLYAA